MKVEVFFDYSCPFCYKGYQYLQKAREDFPDAEVVWRTCEAHPLPEEYPVHSHLSLQGMHYVQEHGGNLEVYHDSVFRAVFEEEKEVEDINVLAGCAKRAGVDSDGFIAALKKGSCEKAQKDGNVYAYDTCKVWAVPVFITEQGRVDAKEGIGVTQEEVYDLLKGE